MDSNQPRTHLALLAEGDGVREQNNAAITYFTVAGGQIVDERGSPDRKRATRRRPGLS